MNLSPPNLSTKPAKVRDWLQQNKILFEIAGWTIVPAAALFLSYMANEYSKTQVELMDSQNKLVEKQFALLKQQTELARIQADVARVGISPKFVFSSEGKPPHLLVKNDGFPVRNQQVESIYFYEINTSSGVKRVSITGVYPKEEVAWRSGNTYFYYSDLDHFHLRDDKYWDKFARNISDNIYLKISYVNGAGERRSEQFMMETSGLFPTPVHGPPKIDFEYDVTRFQAKQKEESPEQKKKRLDDAARDFYEFLETHKIIPMPAEPSKDKQEQT